MTKGRIDTIQFGILSPQEIMKQSVCEVMNSRLTGQNSVYDERMGILENGKICETCEKNNKECIGHFGHINLNIPIIHPLFYKSVVNILRCVCYRCSRLLATKDQLEFNGILKSSRQARFRKIIKFVERIDFCSACMTSQPKYHISTIDKTISMIFKIEGGSNKTTLYEYEIKKMFQHIPDEDVLHMGFDPQQTHPHYLLMEYLPVLPPVARPYVISDNITCDDDLTIQYLEIVKANSNLLKDFNEVKMAKYAQSLKFRIKCLFDNSQERSKHSNGRPLKGFKKRLTGKEGQLRNNLMGKRVDKSARTVIGPDPTLKVNEIAVPEHIASILTFPETVNQYNLESLQCMLHDHKHSINYVIRKGTTNRINMKYALYQQGSKLRFGDYVVRDGKYELIRNERQMLFVQPGDRVVRNGEHVKDFIYPKRKEFRLQIGDIVERKLRDGDIVLLNRQPTLHSGSMQAFNVKIKPGSSVRCNLAITKSFNADFDGDEMNIFCPGSVEAAAELQVLSSVENHIISNQSNKPNIVMVQDCVLGAYIMSTYSETIPKDDFYSILNSLSAPWTLDELEQKQQIYQAYNKCSLPQTLNGKLLFSMLLPRDFFFASANVVIHHGVLVRGSLTKKELGGGHYCFITLLFNEYSPQRCVQFINDVQFLANAFLMYHGFSIGLQDCIISDEATENIKLSNNKLFEDALLHEQSIMNPNIRELHISRILGNARDRGMKIAKDELGTRNKFVSTVVSGSKGDYFNIAQIMSLLGQQNFQGRRIQPTLNDGRRTLPHYPMEWTEDTPTNIRYQSQGFIENSFIKGLHPTEFWFHSITGREGITDTAMKTATSGYIQRRMVKVAEDVQVKYDKTVRNGVNSIIQFNYGFNGLEPTKCVIKKDKMVVCDIERLVEKLNFHHEQNTCN